MPFIPESNYWRLLVGDKTIECDLIWPPRQYGPRRYFTMRYHPVDADEEHLITFTSYEWHHDERQVRVFGAGGKEEDATP